MSLDFENSLLTQPICLTVYQTNTRNLPKKSSEKGGIDDGMDTDHNTSYTRDIQSDHYNPKSINHPNRKEKDLRHTLKLKCNNNYRHWISESVQVFSMKRIRTLSGNPRIVLRNWCGLNTLYFLETPNISSWTNTEYQLLISDNFWL